MKYSVKSIGLAVLFLAIFSCHSKNTNTHRIPGNSDSSSKNNTYIVLDSTQPMAVVLPEQDFINYALPKNNNEIIWLKAGLTKGDAAIKAQAKLMLKDYTKLGDAIKEWVRKNKNFTLPPLDTAGEINSKIKIGNDWNSAWIEKSVTDHNQILINLKNAQLVVKNSELNKLISNTIPVMETHLAMVKKMQDTEAK